MRSKELREGEKGGVPVLVPCPPKSVSSLQITDPDLARLVALWPMLPDAIKVGISALVNASVVDDAPTSDA